jgi:hypothetical protein
MHPPISNPQLQADSSAEQNSRRSTQGRFAVFRMALSSARAMAPYPAQVVAPDNASAGQPHAVQKSAMVNAVRAFLRASSTRLENIYFLHRFSLYFKTY